MYQENMTQPNTINRKQCKYNVYALGTQCKISPHNKCKCSEDTLNVEPYFINKTDDWQGCVLCIFELKTDAM